MNLYDLMKGLQGLIEGVSGRIAVQGFGWLQGIERFRFLR